MNEDFEAEGSEPYYANGEQSHPMGWQAVEQAHAELVQMARDMKPGLADILDRCTKLTARIAVLYRTVFNDPVLRPAFETEVQRNFKTQKDFFRAVVYWSIYEPLAEEWSDLKGYIDLIVAGLHDLNRTYLSKPGVMVTVDTCYEAIRQTKSPNGQTGLRACLAEVRDWQRAKARALQAENEAANLALREKREKEGREARIKIAGVLGISLEQYEIQLLREKEQKRLEEQSRLRRIVEDRIVQNGRVVDTFRESLSNGFYFYSEENERLVRPSPADLDTIYGAFIHLMMPTTIVE